MVVNLQKVLTRLLCQPKPQVGEPRKNTHEVNKILKIKMSCLCGMRLLNKHHPQISATLE